MRLGYTVGWIGLLLGAVLWPTLSQATHVRAGEITTKRISATSLTYEVKFTGYYDEIGGKNASDMADEYTFCFGDGTSETVKRKSRTFINGRTSSVDVYVINHTYPGPGPYTISITIQNRNKGTNNLPGASDAITFNVTTTILINSALGLNSTPVMLNPPLDSGRVGQKFCHNPAAFDADGDSLAFRLSVPQKGVTPESCRPAPIVGYQDPTRFSTTSEAGGAPTFTINPITGELCWDAPGQEGQYNFAFIVEEWRNGVLIGEITRDMQIIVVAQPNKRPFLQPIPDLCVEAGTLINQTVTATDPDGQRVIISGFGGVFNVGPDNMPLAPGELISPAYARLIRGGTVQNQPATATFTWQTNCNQIREAPYDVIFKVNDVPPNPSGTAINPTPSLVSFQTFRIQLVGPAIKNLTARPTATANGRAIQLSWSPYTCGKPGTTLVIYRKEGCADIPLMPCMMGLPAGSGYQEIARLPITATTYTDTSTLRRGVSYSYRMVAQYPDANSDVSNGVIAAASLNGGMSLASQQACLELPLLAPVLTQVTVDSTDTQRGRITVRWTRPIGLNPGDLGGPYQYRLQRADGLTGTNFAPIATINTNLQPTAPDTVYVDQGSAAQPLNTTANPYRYRLEFYYTATNGQLTRLDVTEAASSVRLSAAPAQRQITLTWQTNTPWSNDNQTHDIYRSRTGPNGPFNLIQKVPVQAQPYTFIDKGEDTFLADGNTSRPLSADSSYCYRVMTRGRYADSQLARYGILENYSQILCATPTDTTRPCAPTLRLDSLNCANLNAESFCNQTTFTNHLNWQPTFGPTCDPNITSYKVYYARYQQDTLGVLTSVPAPATTFDHTNLTTVAGCYYVTAVNARGLESKPSNKVCTDACPYFVLPNVFTPNNDGKNDVFQPMRCPRFVTEVQFIVYNRWGAKVYESTGPTLAWDGKGTDGTELPSGLYYYQATVRYAVVDKNAPPQVLKGWVQILREGGA